MKTYAYLRVSTDKQDLNNQKLALREHADRIKVTINEFIEFDISSRKSLEERGLVALMEKLRKHDILMVSELSRLGRSVSQVIQLVDRIVGKGVRLISIKENLDLREEIFAKNNGQIDIQTKITVTIFGLLAELERELISQRTKDGLAAARNAGKQLGRPRGSQGKSKLNGKEEEIKLLLGKGVSVASLAKIFDVSRSGLQYFIETRKLTPTPVTQ